MRTCVYGGKSSFLTGARAYIVQNCCFLANNDGGAEIIVGPELGALTLFCAYTVFNAYCNFVLISTRMFHSRIYSRQRLWRSCFSDSNSWHYFPTPTAGCQFFNSRLRIRGVNFFRFRVTTPTLEFQFFRLRFPSPTPKLKFFRLRLWNLSFSTPIPDSDVGSQVFPTPTPN